MERIKVRLAEEIIAFSMFLLVTWLDGGDVMVSLVGTVIMFVVTLAYAVAIGLRGWRVVPVVLGTVAMMIVVGLMAGSGVGGLGVIVAAFGAGEVYDDTGLRAWRESWGKKRKARESNLGQESFTDSDGFGTDRTDHGRGGRESLQSSRPSYQGTANQRSANHEIFNQRPSEFLTLTDQQRADRFLLPNQLDMPWGADADRQAEENGYEGVTSCVERLKGGERRLCHDELKGFVDFGTVNWNESDDIDQINGLPVRSTDAYAGTEGITARVRNGEDLTGLTECRSVLLLDDRLFASPDEALWKSDESLTPDPLMSGGMSVVGVCGLQVNPERTWIVPWKDVRGVQVTDDGEIICDLGGGAELVISVGGRPRGLWRLVGLTGDLTVQRGSAARLAGIIRKGMR